MKGEKDIKKKVMGLGLMEAVVVLSIFAFSAGGYASTAYNLLLQFAIF
jgi:hypothetical protein